jgi:hypothetical protein
MWYGALKNFVSGVSRYVKNAINDLNDEDRDWFSDHLEDCPKGIIPSRL